MFTEEEIEADPVLGLSLSDREVVTAMLTEYSVRDVALSLGRSETFVRRALRKKAVVDVMKQFYKDTEQDMKNLLRPAIKVHNDMMKEVDAHGEAIPNPIRLDAAKSSFKLLGSYASPRMAGNPQGRELGAEEMFAQMLQRIEVNVNVDRDGRQDIQTVSESPFPKYDPPAERCVNMDADPDEGGVTKPIEIKNEPTKDN